MQIRKLQRVLTGSDPRHVMVFTERTEILVQLLYALLVCLDSFTLEAFFELREPASVPVCMYWGGGGRRGKGKKEKGAGLQLTRFRLISSWRISASVLPRVSGSRLLLLVLRARSTESLRPSGSGVADAEAGLSSTDDEAAAAAVVSVVLLLSWSLLLSFFFFRFLSMPAFRAAPLSLRPPPVEV